jgi:hypothetical protein
MSKQVGFLYWRGRVFKLVRRTDGSLRAVVPSEFAVRFRADVAAGLVQHSN